MSILKFFKKIKGPNERPQDLITEDTYVLAYCNERNTLSIEKLKDLGIEIGAVLNMIEKDLPFEFDNQSTNFLFAGNRSSVDEKYIYFIEKARAIKGTEDLEQNPSVTSSQEVPDIAEDMDEDLVVSKLDKVKKLISEIETFFNQDLPVDTPDVDLCEKSMDGKDLAVKDKEISLKKGLIKKFEEILHRKRNGNDGWTRMVNSFTLPEVPIIKMEGIRKVLTTGSKLHGYVVREIAKNLFGTERLKITKMVNPRSRSCTLKRGDRKKLFSKNDEENLKRILNLIDQDLFSTKDGWYYLVVLPINQLGLDIKRDEAKKEVGKLKRQEKKMASKNRCSSPQPSTSSGIQSEKRATNFTTLDIEDSEE